MTAALAHRGPDGEGIWTGDRVALGHRRLSIFDLSERGAQPMVSADGRLILAYNGETYNFKELREPLAQAGYPFRTETDTEVLLAQYRRHGIAGLQGLRGMFAFALWDEDEQSLFLVRDRLGVKPLYYIDRGDTLLFASEIKSLLRHPEVAAEVDRRYLSEWLSLRYNVAPHSLFKGIRKLEPGFYLKANRNGISHHRYWDIAFEPAISDRVVAREKFQALFSESVRMRLQADVPVGIFLSGGLDSSAVALEAAEQSAHRLQTFSVGFRNHPEISELEHARAVANHVGAQHHELILDDIEPELLPTVVAHLEEPIGDPAALLVYRLSEFARRHVTCVLSGEGSDETNLGYGKAQAFAQWAEVRSKPLLGPLLEAVWLHRWARGPRDHWLGVAPEKLYADLSWPGLPHQAVEAMAGGDGWCHGLRYLLESCPTGDPLSHMLYLDIKSWLADDLLLKVDKTTMAHALEARVPFLDYELVEWTMRLPPAWKAGPAGTKLFLREVMNGRLPSTTIARPQQGFLAPLMSWFVGNWSGFLDARLGPDGLGRRGVIPPDYIASVRHDLAQGNSRAVLPAFMLTSLECWFQEFNVTVAD